MAWGCFVVLLLLVAAPLRLGQHLHLKPGFQYSYDCGVQGMQLLVFPRPNQTIQFKVLDEFGNRFEVNNCSICYHWVISEAQKPAVFSADYKGCHVLEKVVGKQLVYENQLVSNIEVQTGPQGSITRDGVFRLHVRCIFNASDFLPIRASIFSPQPPAPVTRSGPLRLELRIATDKTFSSYYQGSDYPLVRLLQEPVYIEVRLLQRTDPGLALMLHQCWATPSASPFEQPQWPILSDGCPFKGDNYRTQMVAADRATLPFWSHYQRFTIATFTLLDSSSQNALRGQVYFFCSASACHPVGSETCSTTCDSEIARHRRSSGHHNSTIRALDIVSSPGAVGFEDAPKLEPSGSTRNSGSRPLLWVLQLLALTLVLGDGVLVGLSWAWAWA
ncbi:zona pellucida sperm-binding protein 1 isoform X2 [Rattus norvegicus]|uniref:ZP1-202 n=1 Tax=Rattus norvegicus TaxID=10116 RepID=A0A8T9JDG1_RAT|nr:ZP1-202 [Rattus norvegicus]